MSKAVGRETQVRELVKCGRDPIYFIRTYTKIQHPMRGVIPFDTYPFQDDCVEAFIAHRFNIVLKSRQLGLSTIVAAYAVWLAIFQKDKRILVIATKLSTAMEMIKKVKIILKNLPKWLVLPDITGDTKQQIEFSNGSSIKAIPTAEDAGRSEALSLLIVDEAAWVVDFESIWTGIYPTLSTGGRAIILSTPNGARGHYHKLYTDAESGLNEFNPIKLMWSVHPERDQAWFDSESRNMAPKQVAQELLCDFLASGDTFISPEQIDLVGQWVKPPKMRSGRDMNIWTWQQPLSEHQYILSADTALGTGRDYSTFHVIDCTTGDVVSEYKGRIQPDKFGDLLNEMGLLYSKALIVPENNTYGYAAIMRLKDLKYPRIYSESQKRNIGVGGFIPVNDDEVLGFNTSPKTRPQILAKLEELIRNKQLIVRSSRFHDEMKTFVWHNGRMQAEGGKHDDLIMSLAIGAWVFDMTATRVGGSDAVNAAMLAGFGTSKHTWDQVDGSGRQLMGSRDYIVPTGLPTSVADMSKTDMARKFRERFGWLM